MDAVANTFKIQVYILIGKAQYLQMIARQKAAALGIAGQTLFGEVLGAVQFDNQLRSVAVEVYNERPDCFLALEPHRVAAEEFVPKPVFLPGGFFAQFPGAGD